MAKEPSTFKSKIIPVLIGIVLVVGIVGGVLFYQSKGYRSIAVDELKGDVRAVGDKKDGSLFVGEHLYDGDFVSVANDSSLTLVADTNKYLYADENTSFKIEYSSEMSRSKVKIHMESGSTLSVLNEKLKDGEIYEVDTPNSTMSVRGTSFRVTVYKASDGFDYMLTEVKTGTVVVKLKDPEGNFTGEEHAFDAGESGITRGNEETSEFLKTKDDYVWTLDYDTLPEDNVERLIEIITEAMDPEVVGDTDEHTHTPGEWYVERSASCDIEGLRLRKCTECGAIVAKESIPATGHTYGEWHETVAPGCNDSGRESRVCTVCGHEETNTLAALGHDWVETSSDVNTCSDNNPIAYSHQTCRNCQQTRDVELPKPEHEWRYESTTRTCTTDGEALYRCPICQAVDTRPDPCTGHMGLHEIVLEEPACIDFGHVVTDCDACNYYDTHGEYISERETDPLGHQWGPVESRTEGNHISYFHSCQRPGCPYQEYPTNAAGDD